MVLRSLLRGRVALSSLLALASCALVACSDDNGSSAYTAEVVVPGTSIEECVAPAFLKKGDKVALISPSYSTPDSNVEKTAAVLKDWGLEPVIGKNASKLYVDRYAGTAEERAADFNEALKDTSIKAIISNRGGYGTIQLVDLIDQKAVRKNPKWLVGFSDISTLHAMETKAGVMSIHGTMSSFIAKTDGKDENSTLLRDLLMGDVPKYKVPAHKYNQEGKAEGVLVGGNMATFVPLLGSTVDVFSRDGIVLFMEEVGESMHNIDRMFNALVLNGVMKNVRGVILGDFADCGTEFSYESIEEMLSEYLKEYGIPVICGFPAGHGDVNFPLVMGAKVSMDVTKEGATVAFNLDAEEKTVETGKVSVESSLPLSTRLMLSGKSLAP